MFKVNNKDIRTTPVFIVNFEHTSHLVLVFLLLSLNMQLPAGRVATQLNYRKMDYYQHFRGNIGYFLPNPKRFGDFMCLFKSLNSFVTRSANFFSFLLK